MTSQDLSRKTLILQDESWLVQTSRQPAFSPDANVRYFALCSG
jgi:hypothetical protein